MPVPGALEKSQSHPHLSSQGPRVHLNSHFKRQGTGTGTRMGVRPRSIVCHQDKAFVRGKVADVRGPSDWATGQWSYEGLSKEVPCAWGVSEGNISGTLSGWTGPPCAEAAGQPSSPSPLALDREGQAGKGQASGTGQRWVPRKPSHTGVRAGKRNL